MEFNSFTFLWFLLAVLGLHYTLPRPWRRWLLLVASYVFYGAWNWNYLLLIAGTTALDFWIALRMAAVPAPRRRPWLWLSLCSNLGVLAVFKYTNFFIASFCALTGLDAERHLLDILLPAGISFFTFQSMSYTIDVYRGHIEARRSLVDFALFVSFFPQLVAGPIIKASEFFPHFDHWRAPTDSQVQRGLSLMLLGLLQKTALADNLAPLVEGYFGAKEIAPGFAPAATAVLAFGLQIFFDFAGYSNIAIGCALLFGYPFPVNFRQPYLAGNVAEFWHRWHISLSTWLREYLYISLGGNRGTGWQTQRNLMLTMLLGGLWHGARWNFVIWGGLHGSYLVVHRAWKAWAHPRLGQRVVGHPAYRLAAWALTLAAVGLAWVFFRATTLERALRIAGELLLPTNLGSSLLSSAWFVVIAATLAVAWLADRRALERIDRADWRWRGVVFAAMLWLLTVFAATEGHVPFLYFQF